MNSAENYQLEQNLGTRNNLAPFLLLVIIVINAGLLPTDLGMLLLPFIDWFSATALFRNVHLGWPMVVLYGILIVLYLFSLRYLFTLRQSQTHQDVRNYITFFSVIVVLFITIDAILMAVFSFLAIVND